MLRVPVTNICWRIDDCQDIFPSERVFYDFLMNVYFQVTHCEK
jgi:hypothetical protein